MKKISLLLLLLFLSFSISAQEPDRQWLNLYRYNTSADDSLVTNDTWFFSSEGRENPQEEFNKAIKVLSQNPNERCRFPARTLYLQRKGLIKQHNDQCPKYNYFKRKVKLDSIWMVFASYYVNNPSSAFGHTLFKIKGKGNNNDYLEWGVNFAAQMTTKNPFLYAVLGLTGGFKGNFSLLPYFIKIAEYNDSEIRDLWEYELNFTEEEKELFIAHLWEMDKAQFDYYYLTENCSYHLLFFLDAIRPSLNFVKRMNYFVLPSETLLLINQTPNLVSQIKQRPSQFKKVKARFSNLSPEAQKTYESDKEGKELPKKDQADLLDFKIDLMDLEKNKALLQKDPSAVKQKRELQARRASLYDIPTQKLTFNNKNGPHKIHPPRYLSLGYDHYHYSQRTNDLDSKLLSLTYRFSFHEYEDSDIGAPNWSQLIMGKIKLTYETERKNFQLKDFTLFRTEANQANIHSGGGLTWGMVAGARDNIRTYTYDLGPYLETLVGVNWRYKRNLFRIVLPFEMDYSQPEVKGNAFKYSGNLLFEAMRLFHSKLRMRLSLGATMDNYRHRDLSFISKINGQYDLGGKFSIRLEGQLIDEDVQAQSQLLYYF